MSEKKYSAADSNFKKAMRMLRTQGLFKTGKKVANYLKLHKRIDYMAWAAEHEPSQEELQSQRELSVKFSYRPFISIVVPLYRTPEKFLSDLIESVRNQTYDNWELCLADGSEWDENHIRSFIEERYKAEGRIKYRKLNKNLGISGNTNEALAMASGEWIIFGDHDDTFAKNALFECVRLLNDTAGRKRTDESGTNSAICMIYTDEDKMDPSGQEYFYPHFKPDFNLDLLRSINYICHMLMVRRDIADLVQGFRNEYDGAQDYDFILRCIEAILEKYPDTGMAGLADMIRHVPKVLYHWRVHSGSTAASLDTKDYAHKSGLNALTAHYNRLGIPAKAFSGDNSAYYRTEYDSPVCDKKYHENEPPAISVIIPNMDHTDELKKCIHSILKQEFENYEILIIENNSVDSKTFAYYDSLKAHNRIRVLNWENAFNYSAINNFGAENASGRYLLFLNNDTEMIDSDCLRQLVSFCQRPEVGIVGARLYYPNGALQHAGVFIGYEGRAGHLFAAMKEENGIYFNRSRMAQDFSAVTAACMMVKKEVFHAVDGFDEKLQVALNDIDFCLRVREKKYLVAYNPAARLYHAESVSRGLDENPVKKERFEQETSLFRERWAQILQDGDPYYNENLTLEKADCSLK